MIRKCQECRGGEFKRLDLCLERQELNLLLKDCHDDLKSLRYGGDAGWGRLIERGYPLYRGLAVGAEAVSYQARAVAVKIP